MLKQILPGSMQRILSRISSIVVPAWLKMIKREIGIVSAYYDTRSGKVLFVDFAMS